MQRDCIKSETPLLRQGKIYRPIATDSRDCEDGRRGEVHVGFIGRAHFGSKEVETPSGRDKV